MDLEKIKKLMDDLPKKMSTLIQVENFIDSNDIMEEGDLCRDNEGACFMCAEVRSFIKIKEGLENEFRKH